VKRASEVLFRANAEVIWLAVDLRAGMDKDKDENITFERTLVPIDGAALMRLGHSVPNTFCLPHESGYAVNVSVLVAPTTK
jgi:hypothetical protein